jgi:hypothetical protein
LAAGPVAGAEVPPAAPAVDFARDIRPILSEHCFACHGPDEKARKARLRLDDRAAALARKAFVPNDAKASRLVKRIESADGHGMMPPARYRKPLSATQKRLLRAWVEGGAPYARHWAFAAPTRPVPPGVKTPGWARNPLDAFTLHRLESEGLRPSPEADRPTLLRRLALDLTGLPPTPAELDTFLADARPGAYERAVDRLLSSPRHAERMAQAWLDVARYADTNGFNNDEDRTQWPWRDWVIDAFRANMPYDQFVVEQLAGDLLPGATLSQKVATAFHRNQTHNTEGGIIPEEYRVEYVADRVHTTATVFLGLSMQCARCHDHKYDPISQRDYYRFFAFFNSAPDITGSYAGPFAVEPVVRVPSRAQRERLAALERRRADARHRLQAREKASGAAVSAWEQSLTPAERAKLAGAGLLLHIPLDESKGDAVADAAGRRRGTVRGKAAWGPGKVGGALAFDGKTHVEIADAPALDADAPFSVAVWAHTTARGAMALVSKMDDAAAHRGYDVLLEDGKVAVHLVHRWPGDAIKVLTKAAVPPGGWHHVAVSYDGSRKAAGVKAYIDGKPQPLAVANDALRGTILTDRAMHLGRRQAGTPFRGKLDDVQVFGVALSAENAAELASGRPARLSGGALAVPARKRTPAQHAQVRRLYLERDPAHARLRAELADLSRQKAELEKALPALMVMGELPKPRETFVLRRGEYDKPGEKVAPGVPSVLPPFPKTAPANRLGLARWLVHPSHPLTARVAANRLWQMVHGTGLVRTAEDFGVMGELPSHPELLDFLAAELVEGGWDMRALLRLIVTSSAYRQSSRLTKQLRERDPENRLLARAPRFRLPAEGIRDNALAASGLLVERLGGPSVKPYQPGGLWEDVTVERRGRYVPDSGDGLYRRGLYTFWKRTCPPPALMSFDAPNREVCVARRAATNTPLQALVLLNDPTHVEAARKLAERILRAGGADRGLAFGFRCVTARQPSAAEVRILLKVRDAALARFRADRGAAKKLLAVGASPRDATLDECELAAWAIVASTVLNLDEAITRR